MKKPWEELGRRILSRDLVDQNKQTYASQIARVLQLQRPAPGYLDPTVGVGIQLDDFADPQYLFHRQTNQWQASVAVVGGAGRTYVQIYALLQTSRVLAVLTRVVLINLNAARGDYNFGIAQPTAGDLGVTGYGPTDNRQNGQPYFRMDVHTAVGAPVTPTQGSVSVAGFTQIDLPMPYVLSSVVPSSSFKIVDSVAARGIGVTAFWTERPMVDSE